MCIILVGNVTRPMYEAAKAQNSHGLSFFTRELGLVKNPRPDQVERALNKFGVWHFRIASSGKIDINNIHPFPVAKGTYYLYHNGVLGKGTDTESDTNCLAKTLYNSPLNTVRTVLTSLASGSSNKFILVSASDPAEFYMYGNWVVDAGVLMSHSLYYNYSSGYNYTVPVRIYTQEKLPVLTADEEDEDEFDNDYTEEEKEEFAMDNILAEYKRKKGKIFYYVRPSGKIVTRYFYDTQFDQTLASERNFYTTFEAAKVGRAKMRNIKVKEGN